MSNYIQVYFDAEFDSELIAEFRSESLVAMCRDALKKEAKLRECKVRYEYHRVLNINSIINEGEEERD